MAGVHVCGYKDRYQANYERSDRRHARQDDPDFGELARLRLNLD